jgi:hypothetical protein
VDVMEPGAAIGRDIAKGESVEAEIDAFISRRDAHRRKSEGDRGEEEAFMVSERAYFARLEAERRAARRTYHEGQAARLGHTLGALVAYHEAEAEKYGDHDQRRTA